ncbi:MAG: uroporphyrinogen-III C-methyltransferase [Oscillospiraceae bacterium]|nr:uroporphyrinogen-III C-methyltransferase [Oscillospiraceae bacterium]
MNGKVYIIGAGCGAADLITVRGLEYLRKADTVVYDALIDSRLLSYASDGTELICAGKRAGSHSASQDEINEILVKKALEGHTVARLKGGDPFVFGRGGEEIAALNNAGIPFDIVPAVSSAIAVPELAGIPVTHRKTSRSFHVITGHTAGEEKDYSVYALTKGTLVFLMGLNNIGKITSDLISGGKSPDTPAAVISDGAAPEQKVVRGNLGNIAEKSITEKCTAPAVIVIGETAAMDLSPTLRLPLENVTVTVTGTAGFCDKTEEKLRSLGASVNSIPHLVLKEYDSVPSLDKAFGEIEKYGCIAFTGRHGAEIFLKRMKERHIDIRRLSSVKIAAIGKGTAEFLSGYGIFADIVPQVYTSAELALAIGESDLKNRRILALRAEKGSEELITLLTGKGFETDEVKLYDTCVNSDIIPESIETDYIVFGSAAGINGFTESGSVLSEKTKIVCIGSVTAGTQKKFRNIITAEPYTVDGIINSIITEESK